MNDVVLVNEKDEQIGVMDKMKAHELGVLHRAFSIFIFNSKGQLLLQRRADNKYHSASLWTNTCCSHPGDGEELIAAGNRRLMQEMGMKCQLRYVFNFIYKAALDNELIEHELDHVLVGFSDEKPVLNPEEVSSHRYESPDVILQEMKQHPERFTEWFKISFARVLASVLSKAAD